MAVRFGTDPNCPVFSKKCFDARLTSRFPHCIFMYRLKSASKRCIIRSLCIHGLPGSFSIMTLVALDQRDSDIPVLIATCIK